MRPSLLPARGSRESLAELSFQKMGRLPPPKTPDPFSFHLLFGQALTVPGHVFVAAFGEKAAELCELRLALVTIFQAIDGRDGTRCKAQMLGGQLFFGHEFLHVFQ